MMLPKGTSSQLKVLAEIAEIACITAADTMALARIKHAVNAQPRMTLRFTHLGPLRAQ
jgi:hypothetical protein